MNARIRALLLVVVMPCAALFVWTGCEESGAKSGDVFRIEPSQVTLTSDKGSVVLQVVGGIEPFSWKVSDSALGTVPTNGTTVTYTRTTATGANTVQVEDSRGWTAKSVITQTDKASYPAISPTSATLDNDGDMVVFTGSAGVGPYRWDVGDEARGDVDYDAWSQATYTRKASGDNTVILMDKNGHTAIAQITQPAAASLAISPASASVSTNGGTVVFTALGGTPAYTWSFVANPSGSTLSPAPLTSGSTKTYICPACTLADTDKVSLKDADGTEVFATITKK